MGHIRKRSGSWEITFELPRAIDGKRRQKTITVRGTKRMAEKELARIEYERDTGKYFEPTTILFGQYLQEWLKKNRTEVSSKTHQEYEKIISNHILPRLGNVPLARLRKSHIEDYLEDLKENGRLDNKGGLSGQTRRHHFFLLHQVLDQAVGSEISLNPADGIKPPKATTKEMQTLNEAEVARLLEYVKPSRLHIPVLVAVTGGTRRGEVLGLRWHDIDLEAGSISVRRSLQQTKNGLSFKEPKTPRSKRLIILPSMTVDALRRRKAEARLRFGPDFDESDLVCTREDGRPWPPDLLSRNFTDFIRRTDLPQIRFHDCRHTFATIAMRQGIHPKIVSEALGHSSVAITLDLYSHVVPTLQMEAALRIDEALQKAIVVHGTESSGNIIIFPKSRS